MKEGFVFLSSQGNYAFLAKASSWSERKEVRFSDDINMSYIFTQGECILYEKELSKCIKIPAKEERKVILGE